MMPTQYPYPEKDWAEGKMRMARATGRGLDPSREYRELEGLRKEKGQRLSQAGDYPTLSEQEFNTWMGNAKKGSSTTFDKNRPYMPDLSGPIEGGFMMHKDHPQLNDLKDNFEIFNLPGGKSDFLFLRQKQDSGALVGQAPGPSSQGWETG